MAWPSVAIHSTLTAEGQVFTYGDEDGAVYDIWDPQDGTHVSIASLNHNTFCSATVVIPNSGSVLIAGGDLEGFSGLGSTATSILSSATAQLEVLESMAYARWYPTATTLPNGEILIHGGSADKDDEPILTPEIYNQSLGWRQLAGATSAETYSYNGLKQWFYPRSWVVPDGRVFGMTGNRMCYIDPTGHGTISNVGTTQSESRQNKSASVMIGEGLILQVGGGRGSTNATTDAAIIDVTGQTPVFTSTGSLNIPRYWPDATLLPDGSVLVNGGSAEANTLVDVALPSERWDPATGQWTVMDSEAVPRLYHSSSLLLPDGRVLSAGGGKPGPADQYNAQLYSPPYLFDAAGGPVVRLGIASVPQQVVHGTSFSMTMATTDPVDRVTMVKTGAATHSWNMEQRFLELSFTQTDDQLLIDAPVSAAVATPGNYLLTALDSSGVPSVSEIVAVPPNNDVLLPPPDLTPPVWSGGSVTVSNLTPTNADLDWTESATDDVMIGSYTVLIDGAEHSTIPTSPSKPVSSAALTGLVPGQTFLIAVEANDLAGNRSVGGPTVSITAPLPDSVCRGGMVVWFSGLLVSPGSVSFSWSGAMDDVGVVGYNVYVDGALVETTVGADVVLSGLSPATGYTARVEARDAAGNVSVDGPVVEFATAEPAESLFSFSTLGSAPVSGVGGSADDADVYAWDGVSFSRVLDGSGVGLPGAADIDGLTVVGEGHFFMSFAASGTAVPGLGVVGDEDVVEFDDGVWSFVFDGTAAGLTTSNGHDIDALTMG